MTNRSDRLRHACSDISEIQNDPHLAIVALGSNMGERLKYLQLAVDGLGLVTAMSSVYETDPVGGPDNQGAFLNMVVEIETELDPFALLSLCQQLEVEAARQRLVHWGPRTLDVDILFYDDLYIDDPQLKIPHPRYHERRFVLEPLSEIAPERCPEKWDQELPSEGVSLLGRLEHLVSDLQE